MSPDSVIGVPEPWSSFLLEVDGRLKGLVELRCLGGFALTQAYGLSRPTQDIDFLSAFSESPEDRVEAIGGLGTPLAKKHHVYLQYVGIVTPPCDYFARMTRMFPSAPWKRLRVFALDPTDIALCKLERNTDKDRFDVQCLARAGYLDTAIMRQRYVEELRPYLYIEWHDKTLELWIQMIENLQSPTLPAG